MEIYFFIDILILLAAIFVRGKNKEKIFLIISFGILTFVAAVRDYTVGFDLQHLYIPKFRQIAQMGFNELNTTNLEYGFSLLVKIISMISNEPQIFIIITSIITIPVYGIFIYRHSKNVVLSTLLFVFLNMYFMTMNIVRQQIAVAIILIAFEFLIKNRKKEYIILVLIATSIHLSAIICLLFLPLYNNLKFNTKTFLLFCLFGITFCVCYKSLIELFSSFMGFLGLNNNKDYTFYLTGNVHGQGVVNLNNLSALAIGIYFFWIICYYLVNINKEQTKEDFFYTFMSLIYCMIILLSMRMQVLSRINYYIIPFIIIAVPNAISYSKLKFNKNAIILVLFVLVLIRYGYIFVKLADVLYGISPYKFYWDVLYETSPYMFLGK